MAEVIGDWWACATIRFRHISPIRPIGPIRGLLLNRLLPRASFHHSPITNHYH